MKNYYEILQVKNFAEIEVIKASYKALCKINNAYDVLGKPLEKEKYDKMLKEFLLQKENDNKHSDDYNVRNYEQNIYTDSDKNKLSFLVFRIPLSILISLCIGIIVSYLILGIISIDGSWSYIIYTIHFSIY